jgi:hypothetical protein
MQTNSLILKPMKATLVAIAMLVSAASIQAQGLIVQNTDSSAFVNLGTGALFSVGDFDFNTAGMVYSGMPQTPSSQGIQIHEDTGSDVPPPTLLPPAPVSDPSSDFQPSVLSIQPAPEPSTLALGGLALGLIIVFSRFGRHQKI